MKNNILNLGLTNCIKLVAVVLIAISQYAWAGDFNLPDLGTPSDSIMSPTKEKEIRDSIINQIYEYDLVMSDPIIADYIEQLGYRLAANSSNPKAPFDFFIVNNNVINASAYPGGLIVIFSGLFLKTESESELAGVVAHEIAHATGRHISRAYANIKKTMIPTILGMVGAALAAQYSDSRDAPIAIAAATSALQQQSMINFTRSNEYEADRVGISTLKKAGFNPMGMAGFFGTLLSEQPIDKKYHAPEYSRTHPLTINRVSEAKNRAQEASVSEYTESELYPFVKERIRVLTKHIEIDSINYYRKLFNDKDKADISNAELYGHALALHHANKNSEALAVLKPIETTNQTALIIAILEANIITALDWDKGSKMFASFYKMYPENPIVIEPYIQILVKNKNFKNTKKARLLARALVQLYPQNANYYQLLAVTNQNASKSIEANEALAMKQHIIHNNYRAVRILKNILKDDLDYYQRARIESKVTEFESLITAKERTREIMEEKTGRRRY